MLTVLYFNAAGEVFVSRVRPEIRWFQAEDQFHIIPKESIYYDSEGKYEPIAVIFQDVLVANGAKDPEKIETAANMEVTNIGVESRKVPVSKRWARSFSRLITWSWRVIYFLGVFFGIVFAMLVLLIVFRVIL